MFVGGSKLKDQDPLVLGLVSLWIPNARNYQAGYRKAVGHFPFDTRATPSEEAFAGLGPNSWQPKSTYYEGMNTRQLISTLKLLNRFR